MPGGVLPTVPTLPACEAAQATDAGYILTIYRTIYFDTIDELDPSLCIQMKILIFRVKRAIC
jgi:hypothetical protein